MKFQELKSTLNREPLQKLYLLEGEDGWLISSAERQIRAKCGLQLEELNFLTFYGDETASDRIFEALEGIPFGCERRLVLVREWEIRAKELAGLKRFVDRQDMGTVLVISNRKTNAELAKKFPGVFVDCRKESEPTVENWTAALSRQAGLSLSREAVSALCAFCLYDMGRITGELKKLSDRGFDRVIEVADVEEYVAKETDYRVFELTDSIQKKDGKAMGILEDLLGKSDSSGVLVIGALFSNFSRMYAVKTSGLSAAALAKKWKVKEFAVKMSERNAARYSAATIRSALSLIQDAEFSLKSGRISPDLAVRQLVFRLCAL